MCKKYLEALPNSSLNQTVALWERSNIIRRFLSNFRPPPPCDGILTFSVNPLPQNTGNKAR